MEQETLTSTVELVKEEIKVEITKAVEPVVETVVKEKPEIKPIRSRVSVKESVTVEKKSKTVSVDFERQTYEIVKVVDDHLTWEDAVALANESGLELPTRELLLQLSKTVDDLFTDGWFWTSSLLDNMVWVQNKESSRKTTKKSDKCKSIQIKVI